uniref:Holliday junction resolvase RuvX n=1 Tax=uncultured Bilophila sp. TaxID=529385 RepID=UPI0025FB9544|nr:Holliday junction resolvase RuvX [uncultured Bilophila sp.]
MKYLAIDYGQKRTGIAVSDAGGRMAFPRKTILMNTRAAFFEELITLIEAEAPDAVVIGLPINLDGEESLTTRQARNFAKSLARRTPLPLFWMEEALSSYEAERDLRAAGRSAAKGRAVLDQQAAVRILQSFLDQPEDKRKTV